MSGNAPPGGNGGVSVAEALTQAGLQRVPDFSAQRVWEPAARLRGARGVAAFNEMRRNSAVAGAVLMAIKLTLRKVVFSLVGEEGDPRLELLRECQDDMSHSWNDYISNVLTMLPFGWSYLESVYKRRLGPERDPPSQFDDGRIGWRKFLLIEHDTLHEWAYDADGSLRGLWQQISGRPRAFVPIEKSTLYRAEVEGGNPEGVSLLRHSWWSWYFAKRLMEIEAIGVERNLAGLPVLTPPEGTQLEEGSADRAAAEQLLRRVRNDEAAGVLVPPGWTFALAGVSGAPAIGPTTDTIISRYENRIALSVMAQFLFLGLSNTGSFSLSQTHAQLFNAAVDAIAEIIADTFTRYEIPRTLRLNGMPPADPPRLTHEPIKANALAEIAQFIGNLGAAGYIRPTVELEQWLLGLADAPLLPDEVVEAESAEWNSALMRDLEEAAPPPREDTGGDEGAPPDEAGDEGVAAPMNLLANPYAGEAFAAWPRNARARAAALDRQMRKLERKHAQRIRATYAELRRAIGDEIER